MNASTLTRDDFLAFWSGRNGGNSASNVIASAALDRIHSEAVSTSGCHSEIYDANVIRGIRAELSNLKDGDRLALHRQALVQGYQFDDAGLASVERAEADCWALIYADMDVDLTPVEDDEPAISLLNTVVEFQTGPESYDVGEVIGHDLSTDTLTIRSELDGTVWTGSIDKVAC